MCPLDLSGLMMIMMVMHINFRHCRQSKISNMKVRIDYSKFYVACSGCVYLSKVASVT